MSRIVYILSLSTRGERAHEIAESLFPGSEKIDVSKRELRESGWKGQVSIFRKLRGLALVTFADSLQSIREPQLLLAANLIHRCKISVLADADGELRTYTRWQLYRMIPRFLWSAVLDCMVLLQSWLALPLLAVFCRKPASGESQRGTLAKIAVLYPFPIHSVTPGGEMTYLRGFLQGMTKEGVDCEVYSGCGLPINTRLHVIESQRNFFLFRECFELSYNLRFVWKTWNHLARLRPGVLYQRHGRFVLAGAILSRLLRVPLVLEYQCSESWRAKNWDPARFRALLELCERISVSSASVLVPLSDVLRADLLSRGVPPGRVVINPAAVDSERFRPGCGGDEIRRQLGFTAEHIVVAFAGTFSYWHGTQILQQAILRFLRRADCFPSLRFLLIGDGLLRQEMETALKLEDRSGSVVFTGAVPFEQMPCCLDAADILVSPHVPLADGQRFFGSPTKLFEYMAAGKAIIASDLEQISEVLSHGVNAWLVPPGDVAKLSEAIELLASQPELCRQMAENARTTAVNEHSWRANATRLLAKLSDSGIARPAPGNGLTSTSAARTCSAGHQS
jgi:glycosyltransferase involved in cell wall biosynthesis